MLIINAGGRPRRSERRLRDACRDQRGVLVLNALVDGGSGRTREVDGVLITPHRGYTVEVKGTGLTGPVTVNPNTAWLVGQQEADFYGGSNPLRQARVGAQMLAAMLRTHDADLGFVQSLVAVSGTDITLAPTRVGDTWATTVENLPGVLTGDSPTLLTAEQVRQACQVLGVDLLLADLEREGFPRAGSTAHQAHRHERARDRAADRAAEVFAALPGFLLDPPGSTAGRGSDIQKVAVTPTGVYLLRVKTTTLRGTLTLGETWTVDDKPLYGRQLPSVSAHKAATWLRHTLRDRGVPVRVRPVVAWCGTDLSVALDRDQSAWVCRIEDLAGVFLRHAHDPLPLEDAEAVLAALGQPVPRAQLTAAGFRSRPADPAATSRHRHRAERLAAFTEKADEEWRASDRRRAAGSAAAVLVLAATAGHTTLLAAAVGSTTAAAAAAWQQHDRRRRRPRRSSPGEVGRWLLSLAPVGGVAAHATLAATALLGSGGQGGSLLLLVHLLTTLLLTTLLLTGRATYGTRPRTVYERHDRDGVATGAFRVAARPPGPDWQPATSSPAEGARGRLRTDTVSSTTSASREDAL